MQLYLVRMTARGGGETFYKVGVTKIGVTRRFDYGTQNVLDSDLPWKEKLMRRLEGEEYISDTPYSVEQIHAVSYKYDGDALVAEREMLDHVAPHRYWPQLPFSGHGECFKGDTLVEEVRRRMDADVAKRNAEAPNELLYSLHAIGMRTQDPIERHKAILAKCRQT